MTQAAQTEAFRPWSEHYAGFWVRFLAVCIDLALCTPLYYGVKAAFGEHSWLGESVFCVMLIAAYGLFFSGRWQATPGMYLLKFRITDTHGNRIGFARGMYWILSSLVLWFICLAGVVYLQSRFDLNAIQQLEWSCFQQNVAPEDCAHEIESLIPISFPDFTHLVYAAAGMSFFMLFVWALSIALPRDKTGFHNLICGTRFVKGRPA